MPFTALELQNIANQALDFYIKNKIVAQSIYDRPLMSRLRSKQKTFPGGKGEIKFNVKGDYTTTFMGFEHDQRVTYANPANVKQAAVPYYELHAGISMSYSELKRDGIIVTDTVTGESTSMASEREMTAITGILDDKLDDLKEGSERDFNLMCHRDGTQSSLVFPGLQYIVADNPATGVLWGIDRAANSWWRNRARTAASALGSITFSAANQTLTKTLRQEVRQLRRYGGRANLIIAGSDAISRLEAEIHEKGTYTQTGFVNKGATDIGMADISMRGVGDVIYDPTMDELGRQDYIYILDDRHLRLMTMDGDDMRQHSPARPHDQYVLYRAMTWTGCLLADKLNCHGVYQTAGTV